MLNYSRNSLFSPVANCFSLFNIQTNKHSIKPKNNDVWTVAGSHHLHQFYSADGVSMKKPYIHKVRFNIMNINLDSVNFENSHVTFRIYYILCILCRPNTYKQLTGN